MHPRSREEIFRLIGQKHVQLEKTQTLLVNIIQRADDQSFELDLAQFNDNDTYDAPLIADLMRAYIISSPELSAERIEHMTKLYCETLAQKNENYRQIALGIILGIFESSAYWFDRICPTGDWRSMQNAVGRWTTIFLNNMNCPESPKHTTGVNEFLKRFDPAIKRTIPYIAVYQGMLYTALCNLRELPNNNIPYLIWVSLCNISYSLIGRAEGALILSAAIALAEIQR